MYKKAYIKKYQNVGCFQAIIMISVISVVILAGHSEPTKDEDNLLGLG